MWWRIHLSTNSVQAQTELEALACELVVLGASGTELLSDQELYCFVDGTEVNCNNLIATAAKLNLVCLSFEELPCKNWVSECEALWQPVYVGSFEITPRSNSPDTVRKNRKQILINPGTGFGTGHHASTRLALELLEDKRINRLAPSSILDLGTGSGILAIASHILFASAVEALDIDPLALENAKENLELNGCSDAISLRLDSIHSCNADYDLIIANIYAEVIISLESEFRRCLNSQGYLVLSGIMTGLSEQVQKLFESSGWKSLDQRSAEGWTAILLQRSG